MTRHERGEIIWYESDALAHLGVSHGFFTRYGGVSEGEFESLNVKLDIGDNDQSVTQNRKIIKNTLQYKLIVFSNHLPHKNDMKWVDSPLRKDPATDALATDTRGLAVGLSVADCLPILVSDGRTVAVIHAGWRGTVAKIVEKTIRDLVTSHEFDVDRAVAAVGAGICAEHFEVRGEAARQLQELAGELPSDDVYHADLVKLNMKQLQQAGINQIDNLGICTYESDEFYSFRQSGGKTGRNMAVALLS